MDRAALAGPGRMPGRMIESHIRRGFVPPAEAAGLVDLWHRLDRTPRDTLWTGRARHTDGAELDPLLGRVRTLAREIWRRDAVAFAPTLVRWTAGEAMALHSDHGCDGEFPQRHWAAIAFLNEDFCGGAHYIEGGPDIAPEAGMVLLHPGGAQRHGVRAVTAGERYTFACWLAPASRPRSYVVRAHGQ